MSATSLLRALALLATLALLTGCDDTSGPPRPGDPGGEPGQLSLVPRSATIEAGRVVTLHATLIDEFGDPIRAAVQWRSSDDAVATVAATGEVYGRTAGHAIITATAVGKSQTSTIQVMERKSKPEGKEQAPLLLRRQLR